MEDHLVEIRVGTARQETVELDEQEEVGILALGFNIMIHVQVIVAPTLLDLEPQAADSTRLYQ